MSAADDFQAGRLREAVAAQTEAVRQHPDDPARRVFLAELLCFAGDLPRADKQLDATAHLNPKLTPGISLLRNLIRAEQARQQFYSDGRLPEFLEEPSPVFRLHLEASICLREGKPADASALLAQAEAQRVRVSGTCDGTPFQGLRDLDDLTAPVLEVLATNGNYYWIPIERVERVQCEAPRQPRDLLWRRAQLAVSGGPDGEVYLPTLYAGAAAETDDGLRLGRRTDWRGGDGAPVRGVGQRMLLVGGEARSILELRDLTVEQPPA